MKKLSAIIYERVRVKSFAVIRSKGNHALFGSLSTGDMKKKLRCLQVGLWPIFYPRLTFIAKNFFTELTSYTSQEIVHNAKFVFIYFNSPEGKGTIAGLRELNKWERMD